MILIWLCRFKMCEKVFPPVLQFLRPQKIIKLNYGGYCEFW